MPPIFFAMPTLKSKTAMHPSPRATTGARQLKLRERDKRVCRSGNVLTNQSKHVESICLICSGFQYSSR